MKAETAPSADLLQALRDGRNFLIAAHVQPDGDALGAALGTAFLLRQLGKTVTVAISVDQIPAKYSFLPGVDQFAAQTNHKIDTLVAVDVANAERLGESKAVLESAERTINIDHHPDNSAFAKLNWVDPGATSASEMIFNLWDELDLKLTLEAATCLYVGMLTDTGNWQYSNTTSKALRVAADLLDLGIEPPKIFEHIYESKSEGWLRVMGPALQRAAIDLEHQLAYGIVTQSDLEVAGAAPVEIENLVDWLRSLAGVEIAVVIKETKSGEFKGSARSRGSVDVGAMARTFGGGGHHNAAGFASSESPYLIIAKIKKWLSQTSKSA